MPPFPFIALPKEQPDGFSHNEKDFDRLYVLAGEELRPVEGHLSIRLFTPSQSKMSSLATFRNYDHLIKSLGGVKVNKILPGDANLVQQNGGNGDAILTKMSLVGTRDSFQNEVPSFTQYLVRTGETNIWISFAFFDNESSAAVIVLEEKSMQQTVGLMSTAVKPAH